MDNSFFFPKKNWDFYTIRSVYLCIDCMLNLTCNFNLVLKSFGFNIYLFKLAFISSNYLSYVYKHVQILTGNVELYTRRSKAKFVTKTRHQIQIDCWHWQWYLSDKINLITGLIVSIWAEAVTATILFWFKRKRAFCSLLSKILNSSLIILLINFQLWISSVFEKFKSHCKTLSTFRYWGRHVVSIRRISSST